MTATEIGTMYLAVVATTRGMAASIHKELGGIAPAGAEAGKAAGTGFKNTFLGVVGGALAVGALSGLQGAIKSMGVEAAGASDSTDKFKSTLDFAGLKPEAIEGLSKSTRKYADQTVYSITDIQSITAQLAANGVNGYDKLAEAAGNLNAVAGGNADTYKSVGMVLSQTSGQGKLTTENWNQLADAIPGASGKLQEALKRAGAFTGNFREAMEKGQISAEEFNSAIMELGMTDVAKQAATSTKTFEGAFGNLRATVVGGIGDILNTVKPQITSGLGWLAGAIGPKLEAIASAMPGIISKISTSMQALKDGFQVGGTEQLGPANLFITVLRSIGHAAAMLSVQFGQMQGLNLSALFAGLGGAGVAGIGATLGGAFGPISEIVKKLSVHFTGLTNVISKLGPAFKFMTGPVGIILTILTLLYATNGQVRDSMNGIFVQLGTLVGALASQLIPILTTFITALAPILAQIMTTIVGALGQIMIAVLPLASMLISVLAPLLTNLIAAVLPPLMSLIQALVPAVLQIVQVIAAVVVPAIQMLAQFLQAVLPPIISALMPIVKTVFGFIAATITNVMHAIQAVIKIVTSVIKGDWSGCWNGIKDLLGATWDQIKNTVGAALEIVKSIASSAWSGIKTIFSDGIEGAMHFVRGMPSKIMSALGNLGSLLLDSGQALWDGLVDGLKAGLSRPIEAVKNGLAEIRKFFPFSPAKKGPFSGTGYTTYSGRALVGDFATAIESRIPAVSAAAHGVMAAAALSGATDYISLLKPSYAIGLAGMGGVNITNEVHAIDSREAAQLATQHTLAALRGI